jgi:hypothetical protein
MIHTLLNLACAALVLWAVFKFGEAHALLGLRNEILEREPRRVSVPVEGAPTPPGGSADLDASGAAVTASSRSGNVYDQESPPVNGLFLTLLGETVKAE